MALSTGTDNFTLDLSHEDGLRLRLALIGQVLDLRQEAREVAARGNHEAADLLYAESTAMMTLRNRICDLMA